MILVIGFCKASDDGNTAIHRFNLRLPSTVTLLRKSFLLCLDKFNYVNSLLAGEL